MPGFELIGEEEKNAVNEIFDKSNGVLFAHGFDSQRGEIFRVRDLEKNFSNKLGGGKSVACTSGTSAQLIAMKCLGIKSGDEVITQSFTFIATIEAILACGATPIIVDIDDSYNMCPKSLENAITHKTKMIIPVHMLGNPAKMNEINKIAKKNNILVLEDACESLGAKYNGVSTGLLGDVGVFSLDFGKTITAGEGGLIISNQNDLIRKCFSFIDHGHDCDPNLPRGMDTASNFGFNYRMTELQAAVAIAQLNKLDFILKKNRLHKKLIKEELGKFSSLIKFRHITDEEELADTIIFNFENPDTCKKFLELLKKNNLGTKNVPDAMRWHFTKYFGQVWKNTSFYPDFKIKWNKSNNLLERSISLPIMVNWSIDQVDKLITSYKECFNSI